MSYREKDIVAFRDENIVNIAMRAGELLRDGKIERDEISGHAGLTSAIVELADEFERLHADIDWDAIDAPDYWEEIDNFAEEQLLTRYKTEQKENTVSLWARVGVTLDVPQETYEQLKAGDRFVLQDILKGRVGQVRLDGETYFPDIEQNEGLEEMEFDLPVREKTESSRVIPAWDMNDPVKVYAVSAGGVRKQIYSGTWDDCKDFCEDREWSYTDENRFVWDLEMEDVREHELPEGYYTAVFHYSDLAHEDIENEFVRQHAEELVFCFNNDKPLSDFEGWTWLEAMFSENMSFAEYDQLMSHYDGDPTDLTPTDPELSQLRESLTSIRAAAEKEHPSLADQILSAQNRKDQQAHDDNPRPDKNLGR